MSQRAPVKFYLVQLETGQRYPVVNDDLVIGRTNGDILLNDDAKVSTQHCRILKTPEGLGIHDLGSANGTLVNGARLEEEKVYALKTGSVVTIGGHAFKLTEASTGKGRTGRARKVRKQKKKSSSNVFVWSILALSAVCLAGLTVVFLTRSRRQHESTTVHLIPAPPRAPALESPFELVNKDLETAIEHYRQLGQDTQAGKITDAQLVVQLRDELAPAFKLVGEKLGAVKVENEFEHQLLELDTKLCAAMVAQLSAMADNSEHHTDRSAQALQKSTELLQSLGDKIKTLRKSRKLNR